MSGLKPQGAGGSASAPGALTGSERRPGSSLSPKPKIAVAVSGQGRSLLNFLSGDYPFAVGAVICSNPKALALDIAREHGLPVYVDDFRSVDADALNRWLTEDSIALIALAGFLKPFPALADYRNRVINIHPSLLPQYGGHGMYGKRVHEAVISAQEAFTGATVHFVNERYDEGSIIAQARIATTGILTAEELAHQVFQLECALYPEVLTRLLKRELPLSEGRIWHFEKGSPC